MESFQSINFSFSKIYNPNLYFTGLCSICRDVDGSRICHTDQTVTKRKTNIVSLSSLTHICLTLCDPMTVAHQTSLSITNSQSLFKLMAIMLVMPYNHLILCHPLLLSPSSPLPPSSSSSFHFITQQTVTEHPLFVENLASRWVDNGLFQL